jgi:antitoxin (DNA-binding transcriptional repressor) of toxin-antitoxin stability system
MVRSMKTMSVGQFKAEFSEALHAVAKGESVAVAYGRKHKPVAMLVPYDAKRQKRRLGLLEGKAQYAWKGDGKITDEELLSV